MNHEHVLSKEIDFAYMYVGYRIWMCRYESSDDNAPK